MKKFLAIVLALCMVASLAAFAGAEPAKEITLWTYPIGQWGNAEAVEFASSYLLSKLPQTVPSHKFHALHFRHAHDKMNP